MSNATEAPVASKNPPTVSFDVLPKDVGQIKNLRPGDKVKITVTAEVKEVSQKEPDTGYPVEFAGRLSVEVLRLAIAPSNDFADMVDEDD